MYMGGGFTCGPGISSGSVNSDVSMAFVGVIGSNLLLVSTEYLLWRDLEMYSRDLGFPVGGWEAPGIFSVAILLGIFTGECVLFMDLSCMAL